MKQPIEEQKGNFYRNSRSRSKGWTVPAGRWLLTACAAISLCGCFPVANYRGQLSDNALDQAMAKARHNEGRILRSARDGLLRRHPIGSSASDLFSYLSHIGARCRLGQPRGIERCHYSQFQNLYESEFFGERLDQTSIFEFEIVVRSEATRLKTLKVCMLVWTIQHDGANSRRSAPGGYPVHCADETKR